MIAPLLYDASRVARFYAMTLRWRAFRQHAKGATELAQLLAAGSEVAGELSSDLEARAIFQAAVTRATT